MELRTVRKFWLWSWLESVDVIILNECCMNIQKLNDKMFVFTLYLTIIILNQVSSTTLLQLSIRIDFYHDRNTTQFYRIQNLSNFLRVKKKNRTKEKFVFLWLSRVFPFSATTFRSKNNRDHDEGAKISRTLADISRGNLQCSCLMSRALAVTHCFASAISWQDIRWQTAKTSRRC